MTLTTQQFANCELRIFSGSFADIAVTVHRRQPGSRLRDREELPYHLCRLPHHPRLPRTQPKMNRL
ncbi:hypothetical protein LIPSTDRAFT_242344 [Lipomyces starkeyi NRRL Y-11557]|uniref:Uncharacterized protein n=1 Tax=Lipomyces starkeyi NRRL Y-11557 TaxID=675824 RepID=A0A1E3QC59_LIPST|nr:hypothetical protein LIPSTDRAFT_242344 [Lipomyces starkeyi NRRL Y-11557]